MSQQISSSALQQRTRLCMRASILVVVYAIIVIAAAATAVIAMVCKANALTFFASLAVGAYFVDLLRAALAAAQES